jgi:hypothetical protein
MKTISKRQLVRNPASVAHLKPGETVRIAGREGDLVLSRPKKNRLSGEQMMAELDRVASDSPPADCQKILDDLRS